MIDFKWSDAAKILENFGGTPVSLQVFKTGLPFFDVLRLYGAIDLYIGLREDVKIVDQGTRWFVESKRRAERLKGRDVIAFRQVRDKLKPKPARKITEKDYCEALYASICSGQYLSAAQDSLHEANGPFSGFDSSIQSGIRGVAAKSYDTLQSGQSSAKECIARVRLSQGLLAFAGKKRTESVGDIFFLPVFEGQIDFAKVVTPLRAWLRSPNTVCAQALVALALKTSLFAEGYQDRLTAVVYNKRVRQGDFAYSGIVSIDSTAIGRIQSPRLAAHAYLVFQALVRNAWSSDRADFVPHALAMAYWLIQPLPKHLSGLITSQEVLHREGRAQMFTEPEHVKEVFKMSCADWQGDYVSVQRFAKAVASGIYFARVANEKTFKDRGKAWYNEVTMLRSAPSEKEFIQRAMILIEQGHREHSQVGTVHREEAFDPRALCESIGSDRKRFEAFRDLFRMYLVQESTHQQRQHDGAPEAVAISSSVADLEPEEDRQ